MSLNTSHNGLFSFAAEITGNRHNFSNQPPQLAVVTAPPKESLPKNVAPSSDDPANTRYTVSSVTKKSSRSDDNKGQFYAHMSETTIGTKKTSYSEKVAVLAKETTFHNDGSNGDPMNGNHNSDEPSSTAMVSVDDESVQDDDDIVQGEVVSSQIITSRYESRNLFLEHEKQHFSKYSQKLNTY